MGLDDEDDKNKSVTNSAVSFSKKQLFSSALENTMANTTNNASNSVNSAAPTVTHQSNGRKNAPIVEEDIDGGISRPPIKSSTTSTNPKATGRTSTGRSGSFSSKETRSFR